MSQDDVEKTRDFIAAYNRRDFDRAVAWFHPDIEWVLPPGQSSDSCRGPEEVRRFWSGLDETFEELRLDPQEFVDAVDHVATRLRYYGRGKGSGVEIEEELYHQVTTFEAGKDRADQVLHRVVRGPRRRAVGVTRPEAGIGCRRQRS